MLMQAKPSQALHQPALHLLFKSGGGACPGKKNHNSMMIADKMLLQASKAKEEAASLRGELRLARSEQADRQGTQCNVCLDRPRETVLQPCGHVCLCLQCADRIRRGENQCPVCRSRIEKVGQAYIS